MKIFCVLVGLMGLVGLGYCQSSGPAGGPKGIEPGGRQQGGRVVIDVRTPAEYASGHVAGTTNVPLDELSRRISEVAPDKQAPVAVHCRSGNRSAKAKKELEKLGYKNVTDLGSLANAREALASKSRAQ